jgi:hypothetical protein
VLPSATMALSRRRSEKDTEMESPLRMQQIRMHRRRKESPPGLFRLGQSTSWLCDPRARSYERQLTVAPIVVSDWGKAERETRFLDATTLARTECQPSKLRTLKLPVSSRPQVSQFGHKAKSTTTYHGFGKTMQITALSSAPQSNACGVRQCREDVCWPLLSADRLRHSLRLATAAALTFSSPLAPICGQNLRHADASNPADKAVPRPLRILADGERRILSPPYGARVLAQTNKRCANPFDINMLRARGSFDVAPGAG